MVAIIWKYSSLAALVSLTLAPIYAALSGQYIAAAYYGVLCLLAYHTHRANIKRLREGVEGKISF